MKRKERIKKATAAGPRSTIRGATMGAYQEAVPDTLPDKDMRPLSGDLAVFSRFEGKGHRCLLI